MMYSTIAHAISVQYRLISFGANQYQYIYTITNDGSLGNGKAVKLFEIIFDSANYRESTLKIVTPAPLNSNWNEVNLSSVLGEPRAYNSLSSTTGIAVGQTVSGFAIEFVWNGGTEKPKEQRFRVYDPNTFQLLEEGTTSFSGLQFSSSTVAIDESAGTASLAVKRVGGTNGKLEVNYATKDGTAKEGSDYVKAADKLTWEDGDGNDKIVKVTITDDTVVESDETFTVILSDPTTGASINVATVTINDNDNANQDTDGDGMSDQFEDANGLNKNDPADAGLDPDKDNLSNLEEFNNNTNPNNPDTDGDNFNDGTEVTKGTDPNNASSHPTVPKQNVPTLSEWSMIIFAILLVLLGIFGIRQYKFDKAS